MDHNNFNASSSTKTEEIIKEQAATQEKSCCSNDNAAVPGTPTVQKLTAKNSSTV